MTTRHSSVIRLALLALAVLGLTRAIHCQRVLVVDDLMGPGGQYATLAAAHTAAVNGDRIHVRYGSGAGYLAPPAFDKALRIVGIGATKPILRHNRTPIVCPAGEMLVFDNFTFREHVRGSFATGVDGSQGLVVLSRIDYLAPMEYPAFVWRSHRVVFVDTTLANSGKALGIDDSHVWLLNCRFSEYWAGDPGWLGAVYVYSRTPAITSSLRVVGGQYEGGAGLSECNPLINPGFPANSAINGAGGTVVVSGPATLLGGWSARANPGCGGDLRPIGPRVRGLEEGNCGPPRVLDPMVVAISPGLNCLLNGTTFYHEMPAVIPSPAARGQQQTIAAYGPTNSIVAVFASFLPTYDPIVLPIGDVWLDPYFTVHIGSGGVDAQRRVNFATTIPNWLQIGDVLVYQAASLSSQNAFELSQPGIAVVH